MIEKLRNEVGIDGVDAKVTGTGAAMVRKASRYFPDSWVAAANNIGTLGAKASTAKKARGVAYTLTKDYFGKVKLPDYGVETSPKKFDSFLATPKNSMRTENSLLRFMIFTFNIKSLQWLILVAGSDFWPNH